MITHLFSSQFYSLITPPNKDELLEGIKRAKINNKERANIEWNKNCGVEVDPLYVDEMFPLISPSLEVFFRELGIREKRIALKHIWKNTYKKGTYQEIHEHLGKGLDINDVSGSIFLQDCNKNSGSFYFFNRHTPEITGSWREILDEYKWPTSTSPVRYKAGDIRFFPSYLLHGVTPVRGGERRITVSFNMGFG